MLNESDIVDRLRQRVARHARSRVVLGIGDDCAVYRPASDEDLVFTTDFLIEDIHFRRETHKAADIGYLTLARGLSDIAAMGATPRFCLLSLALPDWVDTPWISRFYKTLLALASDSGAALAGGDLAHAAKLTCDIVCCGSVPKGLALRRDRARAGDEIYVSGLLGGSALGLESGKGRAWKRHIRPEPRLKLGSFLRSKLRASAAMDLSDGLSLDLARLCQASRVSAEIEAPPLFPGASLAQALHGGEDYELLFTVPRGTTVPATFDGLRLTRIGEIRKGRSGIVSLHGKPLAPLGFDHFAFK